MFPTVWWFKYSNGVYMDVFRYFFNDCVLAVASKYLIPLLLLLVLPQASSSTLSSHHIISSWRSDFFFREIPIGPIQSLEVDNTRAFFFSIAVPQALSPGKCAAFWGKPEAALLLGVWSSLNRVGDPDQEEWHCFWRGVEGINAAFAESWRVTYSSSPLLLDNLNSAVVWFSEKAGSLFSSYIICLY